MLKARNYRSLRKLLVQVNPVDLAEGWHLFGPQEQAAIFRLLPRQRAAQLFEELETPEQEAVLNHVREVDIQQLLTDLEPSETSHLARELPPKLVQKLFAMMKRESAGHVQRILNFPEKSVGRLLRTRFVRLKPVWSVRSALEHIQLSTRLRRIDETYLDHLYVTDPQDYLVGLVPLKVLMVAPRDMHVSDLMRKAPYRLRPEMDQEEAANLFRKYKLNSAPVVDEQQALIGVLLLRDMLEVIEEETEEDFAKMVGGRAGLLSQSVLYTARVRLPWLIITCFGSLIVSAVVDRFQPVLNQLLALAIFMPMIAAMGGNVGAQSATVVVRGLATGELALANRWRVVLKEIGVGLLLGFFYGAVIVTVSHVIYGAKYGWSFSLVVGAGMLVSMTAAATMGSLNPFLLQRWGMDPATATGPLITTFTDLVSILTYFSLASWILLK